MRAVVDVEMHRGVLRSGLAWLYETEQPEAAILQHHGDGLASQGNRSARFIPTGWGGRIVIVIDGTNVDYGTDPGARGPLNPLAADELDAFTALLVPVHDHHDKVRGVRMTTDCLNDPAPERNGERVDQVQALRATVTLGDTKGMPKSPGSALGLDHLRGMVAAVEAGSFSADKVGRWLGWAQCALVAANVGVTLDDMKALNRQYVSAEAPDDPAEYPMLRDQPAAYWKRQYKAAEKAKMLAFGYADQAEARLCKAQEAAASELADARDSLTWVRKLHCPSGVAVCQECGRDWPCATIRAAGDSV